MSTVATKYACQKCGSDAIQRVSALVQAETWSGEGSSSTVAIGADDGGLFGAIAGSISRNTGTTTLATSLAPPSEPSLPPLLGVVFYELVMILLVASGCIALVLDVSDVSQIWRRLCAFIAGCGIVVLVWSMARRRWHRAKVRFGEAEELWHRQMTRWNECFYCGRCHSVSTLDDGRAVPADQIQDLL
jgi:hypothetical protein